MKRALFCLALFVTPMASQAATVVYSVFLNGPSESPPNASPGTGIGTITFDTTFSSMRVEVSFSGLVGTVTAAHLHSATAVAGTGSSGVATQVPTFVGFPLGVTAGSYDHTFDMTLAGSWNASYITANGGTPATAFTALTSQAAAGKSYLNIHTSSFGGGEIRGFLTPVPEPASAGLVGLAFAGLVLRRRSRA